jgi:ribosome-binding protein aMBF1 (putative translation factor)
MQHGQPRWSVGSASAPMANRARKLHKSVHSAGQAAFCGLMIEARKSAGLTQNDLAKRLHRPQSFVAKYKGAKGASTSWNLSRFVKLSKQIRTNC